MSDARTDWTICGRAIGSATGWDHVDTFSLQLYDFKPAEGYSGPVDSTVVFRFENGTVETFNDDGSLRQSCDLITAIKDLPVSRTD